MKQSVLTLKALNREEAIKLLTETLYNIVMFPGGKHEKINMTMNSEPYDENSEED